jgi:predicted phosphodiesterase
VQKRVKCGTVVHIGDLVDNHAINYFEHEPDGHSPNDEMALADKHLSPWYKAFPSLYLCLGNHDRMADRKRRTVGLPTRVFRPFREIWGLPDGWVEGYRHKIHNVIYQHGTGFSGEYAHVKAASLNRLSTVIGHIHSTAGVRYLVSEKDRIFGMNVGCGINRHEYAFNYGRDFPRKPVLACGVITDKGKFCQIFPMDI